MIEDWVNVDEAAEDPSHSRESMMDNMYECCNQLHFH